jgi:hypothetical protein
MSAMREKQDVAFSDLVAMMPKEEVDGLREALNRRRAVYGDIPPSSPNTPARRVWTISHQ